VIDLYRNQIERHASLEAVLEHDNKNEF